MGIAFPVCVAFLDLEQHFWWIAAFILTALVAVVAVCRHVFLVRVPLWLLRHTLYRLHVHGAENIPATGPALLVSNHVSHIDALLILAAQRRPIRFLVWAPYLGVPLLRWILRLGKVIPVDATAGPRAIIQALRTAAEALEKGALVCIFAEGGITRTGFLLPFQRGLEQVVKRSPAPIIPVCLDHVWGSIFSYENRRFFWKLPRNVPYHVHVNFGRPLPAGATAFQVRQAIQKLSADSAVRRSAERTPVHRQFVRMACRHPFRPCLIDENSIRPILNYGMALVGAKLLSKRMRHMLGDEAMVGVWLPSSTAEAVANIALSFLGKTTINLNYSSTAEIVQGAIRQCGIKKILSSRLFLEKINLDPGPGVEFIYLEDFRKTIGRWERVRMLLGILLFPGFVQERWILGLGHHQAAALASVIFSSGSTGEPKGIMLTHGNIAANVESMIQAIDPQPRDRLFGILPFFHSFGYTVTFWVPLQVGASVVYHPNPLQAREIGDLCRKYRGTIFLSTPTFLRSYIKRCGKDDFASLRLLICGAEKLPQPLVKEFKEKFGVTPLEGYGCTELSPAAAANVPDWQEGNQRQVGNRPGTIGLPVPGVAARIVNRATGVELPPGHEGSLQMFGANVMKGYLGRDDLTRQKITDEGWYITGDLATMDEDGFITITGREERFAKVGGEMVPLEKVEEELHVVLGSSERLLAVTAIPDAKRGERIIVLHLPIQVSMTEICKQLGERGFPNLYLPSPRDFFQVPELPILGSGKLDINKCKQRAIEIAGT
ncbi:MAG: AMP-binding protein [Planctomycetes bacterium]|nr:AMP-binding protein [Planctomycetota bacterium]